MRNRFLVLTVSLIASTSAAQEDLLACLDPDIREVLLFGTTGTNTLVSRTVPEELTELEESSDLEFIGSSVSANETVAAYKTELPAPEAVQIAYGSLRQAGWREFEIGGPSSGGFRAANQPRFALFCRQSGMASVASHVSGEATYLRMQFRQVGDLPCGTVAENERGFTARIPDGTHILDHIPTLALPEGAVPMDPRIAQAGFPTGISGNGRNMSTQIELETDLPAQDLVEDFGRQLQDQGWTYDAGWSGAYSSGSGWTRSPDGGPQLTGLLDTVALAGSGYRASFRISTRDSE